MTEEDCRDDCEHEVDSNCEYCTYIPDWRKCYCRPDPCCEAGCADGCQEIGGNVYCDEDFEGDNNSDKDFITIITR